MNLKNKYENVGPTDAVPGFLSKYKSPEALFADFGLTAWPTNMNREVLKSLLETVAGEMAKQKGICPNAKRLYTAIGRKSGYIVDEFQVLLADKVFTPIMQSVKNNEEMSLQERMQKVIEKGQALGENEDMSTLIPSKLRAVVNDCLESQATKHLALGIIFAALATACLVGAVFALLAASGAIAVPVAAAGMLASTQASAPALFAIGTVFSLGTVASASGSIYSFYESYANNELKKGINEVMEVSFGLSNSEPAKFNRTPSNPLFDL